MYKAIKKFYCPLQGKRINIGEKIEIPEEHLEGYLFYVEKVEAPIVEAVKVETAIKPKKKVK
jgi:hypothetical protein